MTAPAAVVVVTDCPAGVHDTAEQCDLDPYCEVDDPGCFGNRCTSHDHCTPGGAA